MVKEATIDQKNADLYHYGKVIDGVKTECKPCIPEQWVIDALMGDVNSGENVSVLNSGPSGTGFLAGSHLSRLAVISYYGN